LKTNINEKKYVFSLKIDNSINTLATSLTFILI